MEFVNDYLLSAVPLYTAGSLYTASLVTDVSDYRVKNSTILIGGILGACVYANISKKLVQGDLIIINMSALVISAYSMAKILKIEYP